MNLMREACQPTRQGARSEGGFTIILSLCLLLSDLVRGPRSPSLIRPRGKQVRKIISAGFGRETKPQWPFGRIGQEQAFGQQRTGDALTSASGHANDARDL